MLASCLFKSSIRAFKSSISSFRVSIMRVSSGTRGSSTGSIGPTGFVGKLLLYSSNLYFYSSNACFSRRNCFLDCSYLSSNYFLAFRICYLALANASWTVSFACWRISCIEVVYSSVNCFRRRSLSASNLSARSCFSLSKASWAAFFSSSRLPTNFLSAYSCSALSLRVDSSCSFLSKSSASLCFRWYSASKVFCSPLSLDLSARSWSIYFFLRYTSPLSWSFSSFHFFSLSRHSPSIRSNSFFWSFWRRLISSWRPVLTACKPIFSILHFSFSTSNCFVVSCKSFPCCYLALISWSTAAAAFFRSASKSPLGFIGIGRSSHFFLVSSSIFFLCCSTLRYYSSFNVRLSRLFYSSSSLPFLFII